MVGNLLAKIIGLSALGISGYDTVTNVRRQSSRYVNAKQLERLNDVYLRTDSTDGESTVTSGLQKWVRNWYLDNWLLRLKDNTVGFVVSLVDQIGNNFTTLGLGAVALFTGKGKFSLIKIPIINKIAAGLLAIKAGSFILSDLFGVGSTDPKRNDF